MLLLGHAMQKRVNKWKIKLYKIVSEELKLK